jgi:hypothetical protein
MSAKEKRFTCDMIESGLADIIVGTHAVIQQGVTYKNLSLVIADEQHRFGVGQRAKLMAKGNNPHMLIMSATPIPRTLALILYGDLKISIIDELPPGRKPVKTYQTTEADRGRVYAFLEKNINEGSQIYVVCPLIEETESDDLKNAVDLKEKMQKEKELYDKQYEEEDWNNQLSQEQRKLDEIKQQMVNLSRDTSLSGKSKLEQLKQEYQEQLDSMNTLIREHEKELADERYNEEIEALEKETEEKLKGIEETFSEENVAELVNQALVSGFVTLGDEVVELNGLMTTWLDETGDGLYAIGDYLKTDLIESLQTVRALMSDVGLTNATISPNLSSLPSSSINTGTLSGNNAVNINFGAPLLNIEGNVTEDVMSQVEAMVKQSQKNVVNEISKALNIK